MKWCALSSKYLRNGTSFLGVRVIHSNMFLFNKKPPIGGFNMTTLSFSVSVFITVGKKPTDFAVQPIFDGG